MQKLRKGAYQNGFQNGARVQQSNTFGPSRDPCDRDAPWPLRARKDPWSTGCMTALAHPVPDGWALGTPVVESEGNRSSMRQIGADGWALETPVVESEGNRSCARKGRVHGGVADEHG